MFRCHEILLSRGDGLSWLEMVVGTASGLFWTACYVLVIIKARKDSNYAMPLAAMCANVVWEFIYTFVVTPEGEGTQYWINLAINFLWFALDVGIVITWIYYYKADWPAALAYGWRWPMLLVGLALSAAVIMGMEYEFDVMPPGAWAAFAQNLMMSVLFLDMLIRRGNTSGQSMGIACTKLLGSALASLFFLLQEHVGVLWYTLFLSVLFFDLVYFLALRAKHREEGSQMRIL